MAESGQLRIFTSGEESAVDGVRDVLSALVLFPCVADPDQVDLITKAVRG